MVATIRIAPRSITLTESEIWFTTQTSLLARNRTVTGSRPTTTLPRETGPPELRSNSSSRESGRLQTANRLPSGLNATGCTGGVSKLTNELVETAAAAISINKQISVTTRNLVALISGLLMLCNLFGREQ